MHSLGTPFSPLTEGKLDGVHLAGDGILRNTHDPRAVRRPPCAPDVG